MTRSLRNALFTLATIVALVLIWGFVGLPALVAGRVEKLVAQQTGRAFSHDGATSLRLFPSPAFVMHNVTLVGSSATASPIISAPAMTIPVSLLQLAVGAPQLRSIEFEAPIFKLSVKGQGRSNLMIEDSAKAAKADLDAAALAPLRVGLHHGSFTFVDETTGLGFGIKDIEAVANIDETAAISVDGAADVAGQRAFFKGTLASLTRALNDGSPVDFNLDGAGSSFGFAGRIVVGDSINLAGQASLDSNNVPLLLAWVGAKFSGFNNAKTLAVRGQLDSEGAVFLLKKTQIEFSGMKATGDISFSNVGVRPNFTLSLGMDQLNLDRYGDGGVDTAGTAGWSERPFAVQDLRAMDMQFRLAANALEFRGFHVANGKLEGALKDGALKADMTSDNMGHANFSATVKDTNAKLDVTLALSGVDGATFLPAFTGLKFIDGPVSVDAKLSTQGESVAAMVGALSGKLNIKADAITLHGAELAGLVAHAVQQPVKGWEGLETTPVSSDASINFSDGVGSITRCEVAAPGLQLSTTGEVDALRQAINLDVVANLNRGDGRPDKLKVLGPWAQPTFSLAAPAN